MYRRITNAKRLYKCVTAKARNSIPHHRNWCDTPSKETVLEQNRQRAINYLRKSNSHQSPALETQSASESLAAQFDEELPPPPVRQETKPGALVAAKKRIEKHIPKVSGDTPTTEALRNLLEAEHGAHEVSVLDVRKKAAFADYLIIATGLSRPHVIAIADGIQADMRAHNVRVSGLSKVPLTGRDSGDWIVVDVASIVIHVMTEEARSHYDLESLWTHEVSDDTDGEQEKEAGQAVEHQGSGQYGGDART